MKGRGNTLPVWLDARGYDTALVGKWLNGYGARDAHGEVPAGFDTWRGLLDVSAYDYHNFVMNKDGKLKSWGDPDFARKLVEFGKSRCPRTPAACRPSSRSATRSSARRPTTTGAPRTPKDYSPDVTGEDDRRDSCASEREVEEPVLRLVVGGRAAPRGRRGRR